MADPGSREASEGPRVVEIINGNEHYVLTCPSGAEQTLVDYVREKVDDPAHPFDEVDLAIVEYRLVRIRPEELVEVIRAQG